MNLKKDGVTRDASTLADDINKNKFSIPRYIVRQRALIYFYGSH
jgi:hypothetical protein